MKKFGREDLTIRSIHRNLMLAVVVAILVGGVLFFGFYRSGLLGPIVNLGGPDFTVVWSVSDHSDNNGTNTLLKNSLTEPDVPEYDDNGVVMELERNNSDGSLKALPRFQGTFEYRQP